MLKRHRVGGRELELGDQELGHQAVDPRIFVSALPSAPPPLPIKFLQFE